MSCRLRYILSKRLSLTAGTAVALCSEDNMTSENLTMTILNEFWRDERGVAMAEYALLLSLITVGTIAAVQQFRTVIIGIFNRAAAQLSAAR